MDVIVIVVFLMQQNKFSVSFVQMYIISLIFV